ncbi:hypothetical protein RclHR1_04700002 [Rhizophagus clarus]|uniref:Uncharacterized protein n=1 Tax=Rhizophagus clarus TaxID=94130 RepID=A0A2Z6S0C7_9GLOM|nr:hypothetical protein RclHR1_04700002 [Rhizophagus clarus]
MGETSETSETTISTIWLTASSIREINYPNAIGIIESSTFAVGINVACRIYFLAAVLLNISETQVSNDCSTSQEHTASNDSFGFGIFNGSQFRSDNLKNQRSYYI